MIAFSKLLLSALIATTPEGAAPASPAEAVLDACQEQKSAEPPPLRMALNREDLMMERNLAVRLFPKPVLLAKLRQLLASGWGGSTQDILRPKNPFILEIIQENLSVDPSTLRFDIQVLFLSSARTQYEFFERALNAIDFQPRGKALWTEEVLIATARAIEKVNPELIAVPATLKKDKSQAITDALNQTTKSKSTSRGAFTNVAHSAYGPWARFLLEAGIEVKKPPRVDSAKAIRNSLANSESQISKLVEVGKKVKVILAETPISKKALLERASELEPILTEAYGKKVTAKDYSAALRAAFKDDESADLAIRDYETYSLDKIASANQAKLVSLLRLLEKRKLPLHRLYLLGPDQTSFLLAAAEVGLTGFSADQLIKLLDITVIDWETEKHLSPPDKSSQEKTANGVVRKLTAQKALDVLRRLTKLIQRLDFPEKLLTPNNELRAQRVLNEVGLPHLNLKTFMEQTNALWSNDRFSKVPKKENAPPSWDGWQEALRLVLE